MKFGGLFALLLTLVGCGYSSRGNEVTGQIKKVAHNTPLICPNFVDMDMSLGVIRGGVGSVSNQDQWFLIPDDPTMIEKAEGFAKSGAIVNVTYDVRRVTCCVEDHVARSIEAAK